MRVYAILGIGFIVLGVTLWFSLAGTRETPPQPMPPTSHSPQSTFTLSSPAFENGGTIPRQYTCDGSNTPPPLAVANIPEGTKSLALIMDDPDVPKELIPEGVFVHWVMYNIPPDGTLNGTAGANNRDDLAYTGPCPPPEYEPSTHRYFFKLYALSGSFNFIKAPTARDVEEAAKGMTVGTATLVGSYSRK